ncbi:hypothetical protein BDB00DRAFT_843336 [Zychaea mexicana]|uniref:uncharacterized protein n=1 Tax=Zychaea mexicana TaxID=64656 RepID=UPI0022FE9C55|nr:uncharacterized protein BDB00DRAFT_843336 [Zychaea mexicana]KAI9489418.1 hypothetical protein BDB00DRAFT_843336 [Zychaea mexicana]
MSLPFICARQFARSSRAIIVRHAHKKASIPVRLNEYIEGVGLQDEIVSVRPGLMRNTLFPSGKASYVKAFEGPRNRQLEQQQKASAEQLKADQVTGAAQEASKRQAQASQVESILSGVTALEFKRAVIPETTNTFGSVTADDLASKLKEDYGLNVDKQLIQFKTERIKSLGEHEVVVQVAGSPVTLKVVVDAA